MAKADKKLRNDLSDYSSQRGTAEDPVVEVEDCESSVSIEALKKDLDVKAELSSLKRIKYNEDRSLLRKIR